MQGLPSDSNLERKISERFQQIADVGWFTPSLPTDCPQLSIVRDVLAPGPGMRFLDAGCARGRFLKALIPTGASLTGIEPTDVFVRDAGRNVPGVNFVRGSVTSLPFSPNSFDAVFCIEVMQHIPDTRRALAEFARVLEPGGRLLILDRNIRGLDPRTGLPNRDREVLGRTARQMDVPT